MYLTCASVMQVHYIEPRISSTYIANVQTYGKYHLFKLQYNLNMQFFLL